jgi:hypothetical protein
MVIAPMPANPVMTISMPPGPCPEYPLITGSSPEVGSEVSLLRWLSWIVGKSELIWEASWQCPQARLSRNPA